MAQLEAEVERTTYIDAPVEAVWEQVADVSELDAIMPDVREYEHRGDAWHWVLQGRRIAGFEIRPSFSVTYVLDEPTSLEFRHADDTDDRTEAGGHLRLSESDEGTQATLTFSILLEISVPSVLRGRARAILASEIERLADGFLANLRAAAEG